MLARVAVALLALVWAVILARAVVPTLFQSAPELGGWATLIAAVIAVGIYVAQGQRTDKRRLRDLLSEKVREYLANENRVSGLYALPSLGLHELESDSLIRKALEQMEARSKRNYSWASKRDKELLADVDLYVFFRVVEGKHLDFRSTSVEEALRLMKAERG